MEVGFTSFSLACLTTAAFKSAAVLLALVFAIYQTEKVNDFFFLKRQAGREKNTSERVCPWPARGE